MAFGEWYDKITNQETRLQCKSVKSTITAENKRQDGMNGERKMHKYTI